jgi:hypothetical protein
MDEDVEHLRLDRDRRGAVKQLTSIGIEPVVVEQELHLRLVPRVRLTY